MPYAKFMLCASLLWAGCMSTPSSTSSTLVVKCPDCSPEGYLNRVVLGVWGDSPTSVYFVGGGRGLSVNGTPLPGLFMHWDGQNLTELGPLQPTLWWVTGFGANDVWGAGEQTSVVHWDGQKLNVIDLSKLYKATLSGIWGSSSSDLWATGGTLGGDSGDNDVIVHCTGGCDDANNWKAVPPPMVTGQDYFKIWGAAANDIFLVGLSGIIEHYDGTKWSLQTSPKLVPLLTVNGASGKDAYAVGGPPGTLLHYDGTSWTEDTSQAFMSGLNGVWQTGSDLYVVGANGQKLKRVGGKWIDFSTDSPNLDLHSVWIDSTGKNGFAVGGNFTTPPAAASKRIGVIARFGSSVAAANLSSR